MSVQITILYFSVSMRSVIGQFCGPYFTVWPAKFPLTSTSFLSRAPVKPQRYNKYLTNLVNSVCTVIYRLRILGFFPLVYGPHSSRLGHKLMGKNLVHNLQYGPQTRLVRGMYECRTIFILVLCIIQTVQSSVG